MELLIICNMQIYMERATTRADEVREKLRIKKNDIDDWIENNGIGKDMKEEIMKNIKEKLEKDISADLDDIYSILPPNTRKVVKRFVGMRTLRNVCHSTLVCDLCHQYVVCVVEASLLISGLLIHTYVGTNA